MAESFVKNGHKVFVVTGWRPGMQREEQINGVHVYRVGGSFIEKLRSNLRKEAPAIRSNDAQSVSRVPTKHILLEIVKVVHDHTWKKIYWPDLVCTWYFPALKMAKQLIKSQNISHFITCSVPFTPHLVGIEINKMYPEKHWVVDISDPFCFDTYLTNNRALYAKLNFSAERSVFRKSNSISILTKVQKDKYAEYFPESVDKMFVNPNILSNDITLVQENSGTIFNAEAKTRLVFIGTLVPGIRTPDRLLEVFSSLVSRGECQNLELHLFGKFDYCKDAFAPYGSLLGKTIFLHGAVPRSTALQAMKDADFLVNIGNNNPYQEPSKVVEYASTGKPIINVMCIREDSSAVMLNNYPPAYNVFYESQDQLSELSNRLVKFLASPPRVDTAELGTWLKPYRIESIVNNYLSMLESRKVTGG